MKDSSTDITKEGIAPLEGIRGEDLYNASDVIDNIYRESISRATNAYRGNLGYEYFSDPALFTPEESDLTLGQSVYDPGLMLNPTAEKISNNRADEQPWFLQLGAGVAKGVTTALTTFLDGTVGLAVGMVDAINRGEWAGLWDNPFSRAMQSINDEMEEQLVNYYSTDELNNPWYKNILTANFLGDKLVKNLGFMVGAYYSGKAITAPLKLLKVGQKVGSTVHAVSSAVNEGRIEALNNSRDWYNLHKAQLDDQYQRILNDAYIELEATKGNLQGSPETGYSDPAYAKYKATIEKAQRDYQQTLQVLERDRKRMGNADLIMNIPILTASNIIQFGKLMGKGFKSNKKIHDTVKNSSNILERSKGLGVKGSLETGYTAELSELAVKTGGIKGALSEGTEEVAQKVASVTAGNYYSTDVNNFYKSKIDPDAEQEQLDWIKSFGTALSEVVSEGDTWEEFFIGALSGAIGMPSISKKGIKFNENIFSRYKEAKQERARQIELADKLNEIIQDPKRVAYYQAGIRRTKAQNVADIALENDDKFEYENATLAQLVSDIALFKRAGKEADLIELVSNSLSTSDENLQAIIENTTTEVDGKKVGPWTDSSGNPITNTEKGKQEMIETINNNKKYYLNLIDRFSTNLDIIEGRTGGKLDIDQTEELAWMQTQINNWQERAMSMSTEINDIIGRIRSAYMEDRNATVSAMEKEGSSHKERTAIYELLSENLRDIDKAISALDSYTALGNGIGLALASKDNSGTTNAIVELLETMKDPTFSSTDRADAISKIKDMQRLGEATELFSTKLEEYLADPEKQAEEHKKAVEEASKVITDKKSQDIKDQLSSAKNIKEFKESLSSAEDPELANSVVDTLVDEGSPVATNYKQTKQYSDNIISVLEDSGEDETTIKDALDIFNEHAEYAETLNMIADPNSTLFPTEADFVKKNVEDSEAGSRYNKAKFVLQQAMSKLNNTMNIGNSFSRKVEGPQSAPKGRGVSKDTTGDSGTSTTPSVNSSNNQQGTASPKEEDDKAGPQTAIMSDNEVAVENNELNKATLDQKQLENKTEGKKKYYRPAIPEFHIEASKKGDFRPFPEVILEKEGTDYKDIYEYLVKAKAFEYVNSGNLKPGDEIGFMIDPTFEEDMEGKPWHTEPVIFLVQGTQVVGSIDGSASAVKFEGLNELRQKVVAEYKEYQAKQKDSPLERFIATPTTKVAQLMVGKVVYSKDSRNLKDVTDKIEGNKIIFGIVKNGQLYTNGRLNNDLIIKPASMEGKEGRLYLLLPDIKGTYRPVAIRIKHFNLEEFNLDDATVASTAAGEAILDGINTLANSTSDEDVTSAVKKLSNYLYLGKGLASTRDVNISWFEDNTGTGIIISKKIKNPDGTYVTYIKNGASYIKEDRKEIYLTRNSSQTVKVGSFEIELDAAKESGIDTSSVVSTHRSIEDIVKEIKDAFYAVNPPLQVRADSINIGTYNTDIINSNLLRSNLTGTKILGNWFTMDYFDINGNLQKAEEIPSVMRNPRKTSESPVNGPESVVTGTTVSINGTTYIVDTKNGIYKQGDKTFTRAIGSPNIFDMAWAQEVYGDATEGIGMTENKVITPDGRVLNRNTGLYLPDSLAKQIKDKLNALYQAEANAKAKKEKANTIIDKLFDNQSKIDRISTDGRYYYILEDDGKYYEYSNIKKLSQNTSENKAYLAIKEVTKAFFSEYKLTKPDDLSDEAYSTLLNRLNKIKDTIDEEKELFLANNTRLFYKYPDGTRVAIEADIIAETRNGDFKIYSIGISNSSEMTTNRTAELLVIKDIFEHQYGVSPINLGILPFAVEVNNNKVSKITAEQGIPVSPNSKTSSTVSKENISKENTPIFDTSLELLNPINRVLPENSFNDDSSTVGYYEIDGNIYKGTLIPLTKQEVTLASGEKATIPVYLTKSRNKLYDITGKNEVGLGDTSDYIVVFPNGKGIALVRGSDDIKAKETALKAIEKKPESILKHSSEPTKISNQESSGATPTKVNERGQESNGGAKNAAKKIDKINNTRVGKRRPKLREVDSARETWDKEKELAWLDKVLPQLSREDRLKVVNGLIQVAKNGPVAWGMFSNGIITLSDIAAKGTAYHEAFHVVFNMLLSESERAALFEEARSIYGDKSLLSLEEDMAEGFREYIMQQDNRGLGRRILDFFRNLFAKVTNWKYIKPSLYSYYRMINQGAYSKSKLSDSTSTRLREEEYTDEMNSIKEAAIADGSFMKAPNGNPTNLNERQWLQVRTKAFKNWFGDWEQIAYDKAELNSIPNLRKINVDSFLRDVNRILEKDYLTSGYLSRESVEVIKKLFDLSKTQLYQGNIKEKGLSFYTGAIVLNTMSMEDAARVFVHEILHSYTTYAYDTDVTFRKEINKYHRIALNYNSGFNKNVYEFMANTLNPHYMATLLEIPSENDSPNLLKDIINSLVRHIRAFFKVYENNKKRTLFHDVIETIYNHKRNNSEFTNDVSKVVDENREPLVVYHGTKYKWNILDTNKFGTNTDEGYYGRGLYLSSVKNKAKQYGEVMPLFVNIKNPIRVGIDPNITIDEATNNIDIAENFNRKNYSLSYDGVLYSGSEGIYEEIVIANPNQIKSATSNTGEFSTTNNDIRYREVTDNISKMRREIQKFLDNFSITIKDVEEFGGEEKLFDALNRIINIRNANDLSEGVGEAVAFMMQHTSTMVSLFQYKLMSESSIGSKSLRKSLRKIGNIDKLSSISDLEPELRRSLIKEVGQDIAAQLRKFYNVEPLNIEPKSFLAKLWEIIGEFFNILTPQARIKFRVINNYTKNIVNSIALNDPSIIRTSDNKPGTDSKAAIVDIAKALKENPYERDIIEFLNSKSIALAGSASIALEGTLYRPEENPLHDIDFNAANYSKEDLDVLIKGHFPNNKFIREIVNSEDQITETYLVLDREFTTKDIKLKVKNKNGKEELVPAVELYDTNNNLLGYYLGSELSLKEGVKGKFLDFFIGKGNNIYEPRVHNINGKSYLIANPKNAFKAKIDWARPKDIWDYNRFNTNDDFKVLKELESQDKAKIKEKLKNARIIWGHPAIGKTTYLERNQDILEWDQEVNQKRSDFIRDQIDPEHKDISSDEYLQLQKDYMANWKQHPEYIEFMTNEWEALKRRAIKENKRLFASPNPLLEIGANDFDLIVNIPEKEFLKRNTDRGGNRYSSMDWKQAVNENLTRLDPDKIITTDKYFSDFMRENLGVQWGTLTNEEVEALTNKGWTQEEFDSISQEERDNVINCIAF